MSTCQFVMKSLSVRLTILVLFAMTSQITETYAGPTSPATFASKIDGFRIAFPGEPELNKTSDRSSGSGGSTKRQWTLIDEYSIAYSVTVYPVNLEGEQKDRFLKLLKINRIAQHGISADLRNDTTLTLKGNIKAFEIEMPLKGEFSEVASTRERFFVADGRMYILSVAGLIEDVRSDGANEFLDSFQLLSRRTGLSGR